ncbi:MAG TPA: hypothetical protein VIY69_00170 [Candidatus Acidoferrales bacterium]
MRIPLAALILIVAAFVFWGVGSAVRRLVSAPRGRWAASIGIGLATVIFVGGILNLAHIAYRPVIWLIVLAALSLSINEARHWHSSLAQLIHSGGAARFEFVLATLVIVAVMLFAIATQLPPRQFNYHDDLQKYFAHPVRMLETGTLRGSPLSALGSETLGGQAFLHGIVLSFAPLPFVNGVDAIFALFALLLIATAAAWRRYGWFPGAALGALLVAVINPLYANISGLYTAAVLMATAVLLVADEREEASPVLLGLLYAAMVAIKPTYAVFAACHATLSTIALGSQKKHWKPALAWPARVIISSAICIAPWVLMYLPTYLSRGAFRATSSPVPGDAASISLFSTVDVFDGSSISSYSAIAGLASFVAVLALVAWVLGRRTGKEEKPLTLFAGAASGVVCFLFVILYLSRWGGYPDSVRYCVPFLLGSCVIPALMVPSLLGRLPRALCVLLPLIGCILLAGSFTPAAVARDRRAVQYGSILEFAPLATSPGYGPYIEFSLSSEAHQQIAKYQGTVPAGEPLFAWINTPYWLDYRRNVIIDVDTAGTATPWAHVPANVHYFLWQYTGYATRREGDYANRAHSPGVGARERVIAMRSLDLANSLSALASHAQVISSDKGYVLFKISGN